MRTNRNRNGNDRDEQGRFTSNEGYSNRNGRRSYRNDSSYTNGYSGADSERYPISRAYDDYEEDYDNNRRGGDHREWDSKGFSQFDRSDNDDFRSRNHRYGNSSGRYGSDNDDSRSQNTRASGNDSNRYNSGAGSYNRTDDNDYLGNERRNRSYRSSMSGNNGFGEYDIDHEQRDNRNSSMYGNRNEGMHRGKGPKGYKRSDERIREDINDRLSDDDNLDASEIEVEVKNGEVTLTGTVSERSDKRRAEDVAEMVSGVSNVENRIRISRSNTSESSGASNSSRDSSSKTGNKSNERSKIHESVA